MDLNPIERTTQSIPQTIPASSVSEESQTKFEKIFNSNTTTPSIPESEIPASTMEIYGVTPLQTGVSPVTYVPKKDNEAGLIKEISNSVIPASAAVSSIFSGTPVNKSTSYDSIIKEVASKYELPFDLVKKVIQTESNFNSQASSGAGAQGLMQLMPATAEWLGVTNPMDPKQNIEGGSKYLRNMLDKYNGNVTLALAAYNAGPGNVDKYGGVPPFKETQDYIKKILS